MSYNYNAFCRSYKKYEGTSKTDKVDDFSSKKRLYDINLAIQKFFHRINQKKQRPIDRMNIENGKMKQQTIYFRTVLDYISFPKFFDGHIQG